MGFYAVIVVVALIVFVDDYSHIIVEINTIVGYLYTHGYLVFRDDILRSIIDRYLASQFHFRGQTSTDCSGDEVNIILARLISQRDDLLAGGCGNIVNVKVGGLAFLNLKDATTHHIVVHKEINIVVEVASAVGDRGFQGQCLADDRFAGCMYRATETDGGFRQGQAVVADGSLDAIEVAAPARLPLLSVFRMGDRNQVIVAVGEVLAKGHFRESILSSVVVI